jgi:DNA-binding SARP family transcriptional activator
MTQGTMTLANHDVIDIRGFGTFKLAVGGQLVERWHAGKARELIQFLLLRPGRVVPREALCQALWPDAPTSANTRSSLKVAVHMLRRILGDPPNIADEPESPTIQLITHPEGYSLEIYHLNIDFEMFDDLIDHGHSAELKGCGEAAFACYQQAVYLYFGDFLDGLEADWVCTHREWLRSRYLYALRYLCTADLNAANHLAVMRWCRLMIENEPFNQEAYRALMITHGNLGQLSQVRRWYQVCSDRLREELQIPPDLETRRVYVQAMRPRTASSPGPDATGILDITPPMGAQARRAALDRNQERGVGAPRGYYRQLEQ